MQTLLDVRRHFDGLSTPRRYARAGGMIRAANDMDDLQRGIQLAFAVPETHVASAIGYLVGNGRADEQFFRRDSRDVRSAGDAAGLGVVRGLVEDQARAAREQALPDARCRRIFTNR